MLSQRRGGGGDSTQDQKDSKWREQQMHRPRDTSVFWSERTGEETGVTTFSAGSRGWDAAHAGLGPGGFSSWWDAGLGRTVVLEAVRNGFFSIYVKEKPDRTCFWFGRVWYERRHRAKHEVQAMDSDTGRQEMPFLEMGRNPGCTSGQGCNGEGVCFGHVKFQLPVDIQVDITR